MPFEVPLPALFRYTDLGKFGDVSVSEATITVADPATLGDVLPGAILAQVGEVVPDALAKEVDFVALR